MERRLAFEELFKLGDTPQVTIQKVLDLQASHHAEDQTIGMTRYEQNLNAHRLYFIYLVSHLSSDVSLPFWEGPNQVFLYIDGKEDPGTDGMESV